MDIKIDSNIYIAFDLDDTLYPEISFLSSAFREIASKVDPVQYDSLFGEMYRIYLSGGNVFEMVAQKYPGQNLSIEKLLYLYRNHKPSISLHDGVPEMIDRILSKGGKIGLITNGRSGTQRNKIKALGLEPSLTDIAISEEIGWFKPDEQLYRYVSDRNPGCKFYYFGDNIMIDFIAPKNLQWHCVGVINSDRIRKPVNGNIEQSYFPHEFITSFKEVLIL